MIFDSIVQSDSPPPINERCQIKSKLLHLNHWEGLIRFLDDGRIEIDSNTVERSIRPIVLTRKNALFAGHDIGARNWAIAASLIETCKLNNVNPLAWMTDALTKLVNLWPASRIEELMPWAYVKPMRTGR
jgi:transposase